MMFPSPLSDAWSPKSVPGGTPVFAKAPSPNDPANFNNWFITSLLFKRWVVHALAVTLSHIPPTETHLQTASMEPFYEYVTSLVTTMKRVAGTRGIELPKFTDVATNWKDEAEIPSTTIREELVPHLTPPIVNMIDYRMSLDKNSEQYHWSTFLALVSFGVPIYMGTLINTANAAGMGADETLVPFMDRLEDERLVQYVQVMSDEVVRLRDNAEQTGWREEEAKGVILKNLGALGESWVKA